MDTNHKSTIAVVGATGVVGLTIAQVLGERNFAVERLIPIASDASHGREVEALGRKWPVARIEDVDFGDVDVCFCTAGSAVSEVVVPAIIESGCRVVDNTSAFRMDVDTPLVVPEINGALVTDDARLVSCPNCTTINLVMSLAPLRRLAAIKRVVVTSFQSVSGAGKAALDELDAQVRADIEGTAPEAHVFSAPIAFNCLPQVGDMTDSGFTVEEIKIIEETRKILALDALAVAPTAVRVPVRSAHALSVYVEMDAVVGPQAMIDSWNGFDGVAYDAGLPTPLDVAGGDTVRVARLRRDPEHDSAAAFWVVGDNLRKGAATNSVQIAELMVRK